MKRHIVACALLVLLSLSAGCSHGQMTGRRYASIIGVREERLEEYKEVHKAVWPEMLAAIREANIRNYSIYLCKLDGKCYLFSYYEYVGEDFGADMARLGATPVSRKWSEMCKPMLIPMRVHSDDEWWLSTEEVFHTD